MKKQKTIIIFGIILLGLAFGIYQYSATFKTEIVSATSTVPNPGHTWASMECNSDSLCIVSNKLGIGTSSPSSVLQIQKSSSDTGIPTTSPTDNKYRLLISNPQLTSDATYAIGFSSYQGSATAYIASSTFYDGYFKSNLSFGTRDDAVSGLTEKLRINYNGNVGIGTTSPGSKLEVYDGDIYLNAAGGGNPTLRFIDNGGYSVAGFQIQYNNSTGGTTIDNVYDTANAGVYFRTRTGGTAQNVLTLLNGNVGIGTTTPAVRLDVKDSNPHIRLFDTGFNYYYDLESTGNNFYISEAGDSTKRRLSITYPSGNVGIGTTSPGYTLTVAGTAWVTSGSWSGSDIRWKKSINTLSQSSSLEKVMSLNPVNYQWKTDEYPEMKFSNGTQLGFIAQDVEKIIPEVVTTNNEGYKGISYEKIVPVLTSAIQEQEKKIDALSSQNQSLKTLVCLDHPLEEVCK